MSQVPIGVYLAGPIRNEYPEDIAWREVLIDRVDEEDAIILNPLAGHTYDEETRTWKAHDAEISAGMTVQADLWMVDRADVVVANLLPLDDGYPCIGTLMELGRASVGGALIYAAIPEGYRGHQNDGTYVLHPFLSHIIAGAFPSMDALIEFAAQQIKSLGGGAPHFGGIE